MRQSSLRKEGRVLWISFPMYYQMLGFLSDSLIESFSKLGKVLCHSLPRATGQVQPMTQNPDQALDVSSGNKTNGYSSFHPHLLSTVSVVSVIHSQPGARSSCSSFSSSLTLSHHAYVTHLPGSHHVGSCYHLTSSQEGKGSV